MLPQAHSPTLILSLTRAESEAVFGPSAALDTVVAPRADSDAAGPLPNQIPSLTACDSEAVPGLPADPYAVANLRADSGAAAAVPPGGRRPAPARSYAPILPKPPCCLWYCRRPMH